MSRLKLIEARAQALKDIKEHTCMFTVLLYNEQVFFPRVREVSITQLIRSF